MIAMPISWLPLVCDYSRFARRPAPAFWGTTLGYLVANVWFYALGALILLGMQTSAEPKAFVEAIALLAGPLILLVLLADETDEAWADLYSCAVSIQNVLPHVSARALVAGLGAAAVVLALAFDVTRYEDFLLLIGAVFVPLFGVLAADYFVIRRGHYDPAAVLGTGGPTAIAAGVRWQGVLAWALGLVAYLWIAGRLEPFGLAGAPTLGASLPESRTGRGGLPRGDAPLIGPARSSGPVGGLTGDRPCRTVYDARHPTAEFPAPMNPLIRKERSMRRGMWLSLALAAAVGAVTVATPPAPAQTKKLVFWTHWDQNPDFNKWYADKGKEFAKKTGYEVEVVTIPYQGYEAKYLAAFMAKSGAPDIFMGMTHQWCGQYDFCDKMPADLAKI